MIPVVETHPGALAIAAEPDGAAENAAVSPTSLLMPATSDSVVPGHSAFIALAYTPYGVTGRAGAHGPAAAALEGEAPADAFAARSGSEYALIRAALPTALQNQFDAQLAAYARPTAKATAEGNPVTFSQSDLAKLVQSSVSSEDDAVSSMLVARLAHDVARFGAATVAQGLQLVHDRTIVVPGGAVPSELIPQTRVIRREDERKGQRRPPQPKPDKHDASPTVGEERTFTIDDVVCYGGTTVATAHTPYPPLNDERKLT